MKYPEVDFDHNNEGYSKGRAKCIWSSKDNVDVSDVARIRKIDADLKDELLEEWNK